MKIHSSVYISLCATLILFFSTPVMSQNCGCTHNLNPSATNTVFDGSTANPPVGPGSVVCLNAGKFNRIILKNFIGTAQNPVVLKNCGGIADIELDASITASVLDIRTSRYLKISGLGQTGIQYGIKVHGGLDSGLTVGYLSSDVEIEGVEVYDKGFAGIMIKTDPSCANPATWRENFKMYNISVHHNYVHDVDGEGFYIGNSFYVTGPASTSACVVGSETLLKKAHIIEGVQVYNNIVKRTGCEGIQVGSAPINCTIHDNIIDKTGLSPFANYQNNGLQIGNGTGGLVYNNFIRDAPGNGISCLGIGDNFLYNNVIINTGYGAPYTGSTTYGSAIFMDEQAHEAAILGSGMKVVNNTVINPTENAFRVYNNRIANTLIQNNLVIKSGAKPYVFKLDTDVVTVENTNLYYPTIPVGLFEDEANDDYRIKSGSTAAGTGTATTALGFNYDINNTIRTNNDLGAFATGSPVFLIPSDASLNVAEAKKQENSPFLVYPNPVHSVLNIHSTKQNLPESTVVYDINGKIILKVFNSNTINVENLPKGIYSIEVISEGKKYRNKLVKD